MFRLTQPYFQSVVGEYMLLLHQYHHQNQSRRRRQFQFGSAVRGICHRRRKENGWKSRAATGRGFTPTICEYSNATPVRVLVGEPCINSGREGQSPTVAIQSLVPTGIGSVTDTELLSAVPSPVLVTTTLYRIVAPGILY